MKSRVLVIEDDAINLELIKEMLSRFDCEVHTAKNGMEGVRMALEGEFDLIFCDLHMPEMDGFEATLAMREGKLTVPIVALTANVITGIQDRCRQVGMTDYMAKPIELQDVKGILDKYLEG